MVISDSRMLLTALNQASTALLSELDLDRLLQKILDEVRELFGVDRCALLTVNREQGTLELKKAVGYDELASADFSVPIGLGISGWTASVGLPAFVEDVRKDLRYIPGVHDAVSEIAIPLMRQGEVVGVLDIESQSALTQGSFDVAALSLFAGQCAVALHNARMVRELSRHKEELRERVRQLQVLNHVGKLLGELRSLDEVLAEILRVARDVLKFKACAVLLPVAEGSSTLAIRAAIGYPASVMQGVRVEENSGVTGSVFATGVPRLVPDTHGLPDYIPGVIGGRCEMACPLMARGRVLGVLDAEGEEVGCFSEHHFVLFSTFASQAAVAIRNAQMMERTQTIYYQTISSLADALEARDSYTRGHSERVTRLALELGRRLHLPEREMELVRQAGLLHDIGKIGVPDDVLNKNGSLDLQERSKIENHPQFGNTILGQLKFLTAASKAILHHHERYDGSGYPSGLMGQEIPVVARVISVADAWDAMTSCRPYRDAMTQEAALEEIQRASGSQFDPDVVRAFLAWLGERHPQGANEPSVG